MKKSLVFLILVFATACTFQVDVLDTPLPPAPTSTAIGPLSATPTPLVELDLSATPPPFPTPRPTNTFLPASAFNSGTSVTPIQFAPNGTYVDVLDSIMAGESKTYSVKAMKGQMMSISFRQAAEAQWAYITMRIIGADDSVLCADRCEFWRGTLPKSQTYFVTVTPAGDAVDFVMRVAINPPGVATQSFAYQNKYRNATLFYTDMFAPAFFPSAQVFKIQPELVLQFMDTQSYADTNLSEAYFLFGSSTDPQIISTCTETASLGGPEDIVGDVTINGVFFTKSEGGGVGAGNIYEQTYHRTVHNGTCYEVTYFIHYTNIGNYEPGAVQEFDRTALVQKFDEILSSLVLK